MNDIEKQVVNYFIDDMKLTKRIASRILGISERTIYRIDLNTIEIKYKTSIKKIAELYKSIYDKK
jgi:hypothetical protein